MSATRRGLGFDRFSGLYLWALFIVVFGVWKPDLFLSQATAHSIASSQAIITIVSIAVLVPLATGSFDLSVGAVLNVSTVLVVTLQSDHGWPMSQAIGLTILVAAAIGIVNGFLVVKVRISSFIATLGMATIVAAVQTIVSNGRQPLPPLAPSWTKLTTTQVAGFQIVVVYMLVVALVAYWVMEHTPAGRYLYAVGGNADAARLSGVRVDRWTWAAMITSATLCGVAGVLYASLSRPSLTYGNAMLLPAYAGAFLGSTQIRPGRFNVWGNVIAVYVLATGVQGMIFVTGERWVNDMFNGFALIAAVGFATWRQNAAKRAPVERRRHPTKDGSSPDSPIDDNVRSRGSELDTGPAAALADSWPTPP
jgi:ribose transport system permease protein